MPVAGEIVMDRYRVERMVGTGGMAHVLAARHVQLGTEVAIKVLDPTLIHDTDATQRFAREARAMASLSNKHTVRVYDVGHLASGLPFMVMELLIGEDLGQLLRKSGRLPIDAACDYIEQTCEAVAEAHAAGIIHRDLKPQNLFLTRVKDKPMIRVLDFGIARSIGPMKQETITRVGDMIGTLHYMSPEQIRDSKAVDVRSDVWSLGACFYKLITGYPPFPQAGETTLMSAILSSPPTPIAEYRTDVPAVVSSVIMRCLRKAQSERFGSVTELKKAIGEARDVMLTSDFEQKTEISASPLSRPDLKATLASPTGENRPARAKMAATMLLEPSRRERVPTGPQLVVPPPVVPAAAPTPRPVPPAVGSERAQLGLAVMRAPPKKPTPRAPAKPAATAVSFLAIIVAVAIGVFVIGLALLFVLSRRH